MDKIQTCSFLSRGRSVIFISGEFSQRQRFSFQLGSVDGHPSMPDQTPSDPESLRTLQFLGFALGADEYPHSSLHFSF